MEEFAEVSGISRPTLSKFFQDPTSVRQTTRKRIEGALEEYEYRPNFFALNQNRKLTRTIGIVVPYLADPVFGEIARTIDRRCIDAGYKTALFSSHGQSAYETEALESLRSLRPSGVLLAPLGRNSNSEQIAEFCRKVPTVLFDRDIEGVGEAFVGSDNMSFVSQSVEYLVRSGEPPCFFEMKNPSNPNSIARRIHYSEMMTKLGLEPMIVQVDGEGWGMEKIGYEGGIKALSERAFETSTVLCSNDRLALGLIAACYEKGLRVGRGEGCAMRVAGHDDHPFARYTCPPLTTVAHEYDAVSEEGVATLFDLIEEGGRFSERREARFPARLVLRASA
jgi:DNA-binding LacI/PurR family transcriptional regulator